MNKERDPYTCFKNQDMYRDFCICNIIVKHTVLTYNIIHYIILFVRQYIFFSKRRRLKTGDEKMVFNTGAALLDAIVLAVVSVEEQGTYGYRITQDVRQVLDVSESTLYPVLRRLQKEAYLEVYDMEFGGRNRRYYKVTDAGREKLAEYRREWEEYSGKISKIFAEVEK